PRAALVLVSPARVRLDRRAPGRRRRRRRGRAALRDRRRAGRARRRPGPGHPGRRGAAGGPPGLVARPPARPGPGGRPRPAPRPPRAGLAAPAPPPAVLAAAGRLDFRAMVLVYLVMEGGRYSPYDAHYLPDPGTPVTRGSEPANYRDGDDPPDRTVLCAELPCSRDGELWRADNDRLAGLVGAALADRGLPDPGPVRRVAVRRLPNVYPVYRVGYVTPFRALDAWAAAQPALLSFGPLGRVRPPHNPPPPRH